MMEWIAENWMHILAAFVAGIAFAKAITKMTKTTKDDEVVAKVEAYGEKAFGFLKPKVK